MRQYRAFALDDAEHILRRHDFEAEDDAQAISLAEKFVDGHDVEGESTTAIAIDLALVLRRTERRLMSYRSPSLSDQKKAKGPPG